MSRVRKRFALTNFLAFMFLVQPAIYAQQASPALPSVDAILANSLLATGGRDAWLKLTSMHVKAAVTGNQNLLDGMMEIYSAVPNKQSECLTLKSGVYFCRAYDGSSGWADSSVEGVKELQGTELEEIKLDADFYSELDRKKLYKTMAVTAETDFDGLRVYVVEGERNDGKRQAIYFVKDTGLEAGSKDLGIAESEAKTTYFEDYRQVADSGVKIPTKIRIVTSNLNMRMEVQEIEPNVKIAPAIFTKPLKSARDSAKADVEGDPENGRVSGEVYENLFFPFQFTFPRGWTVHGEATRKVLNEAGANMLAGDDVNKKNAISAAAKRTHDLLTVFEFPLGTPGKKNRGIQLMAEKVSFAPGIKTGKDYILGMKDILQHSELQVKYDGEPVEAKFDGLSFYRQDLENILGDITVYEAVYSTIVKEYAITFVFTGRSKDSVEEATQTMNSFRATVVTKSQP